MPVQLTRYEMDLTQSRVKAQVLFSDIGFFFQPVQNSFLGIQSLSAYVNSGQASKFLEVLDNIMIVLGIADLGYPEELYNFRFGHQF